MSSFWNMSTIEIFASVLFVSSIVASVSAYFLYMRRILNNAVMLGETETETETDSDNELT